MILCTLSFDIFFYLLYLSICCFDFRLIIKDTGIGQDRICFSICLTWISKHCFSFKIRLTWFCKNYICLFVFIILFTFQIMFLLINLIRFSVQYLILHIFWTLFNVYFFLNNVFRLRLRIQYQNLFHSRVIIRFYRILDYFIRLSFHDLIILINLIFVY